MKIISDFILDNLTKGGLLIAILCAYIDFKQNIGKHKKLFYSITIAGAIIAVLISIDADRENDNYQATLDGFAFGGKKNYPLIEMKIDNDTPNFYITNPSNSFLLFDIDCGYREVSAMRSLVFDGWSPQSVGRFNMLRPSESQLLETLLPEKTFDTLFPEHRFNFYINCKNGYFKEQVSVRFIKDTLVCLVQVKKYNRVLFATKNCDKYLFPEETVFEFQDQNIGTSNKYKDKEVEKYRTLHPEASKAIDETFYR